MASPVRRSLGLALLGLAAGLALVGALFWGWQVLNRGTVRSGTERPMATTPAPDGGARTLASPGIGSDKPSAGSSTADTSTSSRSSGPDQRGASPDTPAAAPESPSFDIVRVEPNGDAVVAGRGAPNTVVEMLVNGRPVAKALADPNGQFAIVPPALPTGSSEIQLRSKTADGRESRSKQSVAVAVSERRDQKPLVALTAPDTPTLVLSQPGAPEPAAKTPSKSADAKSVDTKTVDLKAPGIGPADAPAAAGKAQPARIVSVDAQENGRLFVTGAGAPGADLRLYLNDTLIAPGSIGPDGKVTFTIGRGVKPGRYQVRIDQIEPGTGKVRSRAEVPFSVPEPGLSAANATARDPLVAARPGIPATGPEPRAVAQGNPVASGGAPGLIAPGRTRPDRADPRMATTMAAKPSTAEPAPPTPSAASPATAGAVFVPEINTARISRGDNLWRISQRTYGRGERYTVIFDANQAQIRDPDLIYPGQIFVLPGEKRG